MDSWSISVADCAKVHTFIHAFEMHLGNCTPFISFLTLVTSEGSKVAHEGQGGNGHHRPVHSNAGGRGSLNVLAAAILCRFLEHGSLEVLFCTFSCWLA